MVILYTGTPGSGKSYHATRLCHVMTKSGKNVIANFKVDVKHSDKFFFCGTKRLNVKYLLKFSNEHHVREKESQTVIMIDEASLIFNSRDFGRSDRSGWLAFFAQHRKLGYDIILITQMDRSLDRQVRGVIEYNYIHRKLTNFGFKGWIIRILTGRSFVCVHQWYQIREKLGAEYFGIRKKIASSYDTFSMFDEE